MDHTKFTTNAEVSARESVMPEVLASSSVPDEPMDNHSTSPSAPLLPSCPENSRTQNLEPPPYSSVIAQNCGDWKHQSSSFSGIINQQPYPTAPSCQMSARTESRLDDPPPYPADASAVLDPDPPYPVKTTTMPLPGSIKNLGQIDDVEEVITVQPKPVNMNAIDHDRLQAAPSSENEDNEERRKLTTAERYARPNIANAMNTNAYASNNSDVFCMDCCFAIAEIPVSNHDSLGHDSSCCCDDGGDDCCNGCCDDCGDVGCDGGCDGGCDDGCGP